MKYLATLALIGIAASTSAQSNQRVADAVVHQAISYLYVQTDRHWHKGEYVHLIQINKMVIAAWPKFTAPYVDSAWLLWSMDRDDEAVALYDQGIAANPDTYEIYYEKGFYMMTRRKDVAAAIPLLERAVAMKDCDPIVLHSLAHAYEKTGQLDKALETWKRAADNPANQGRAAALANRDRVQRLIDSRK